MANTNSKLYTNKDMARICDVSEASMTNLVKSLELVPIKTGKYGRKYYNSKDLEKVKDHYRNKPKASANSSKSTTKDDIIKQQKDHIEDLKTQIKILNHQLEVKDSQIETQNQQLKQILSCCHRRIFLRCRPRRAKMISHSKKSRSSQKRFLRTLMDGYGRCFIKEEI